MDTINQGGVKNEYDYSCRSQPATSDQVERLSLENLNATRVEGFQGRDTTEQFGFQNLNTINSGFTANSLQNANNTAFLSKGTTDGFTASSLQNANNTALLDADIKNSSRDMSSQVCGSTATLLQNQNIGFKDSSLQASNLAALTQQNISNGFCSIEKQVAYDTCAIKDKIACLELQVAKDKGASDLLAAQNLAHVQMTATMNAKDAVILANLNANAATLLAATNQSAVLKAIAECCCEQKALTIKENAETRMLIINNENQNLRDSRNDYQRKYELQSLRATLLPPLVGSAVV